MVPFRIPRQPQRLSLSSPLARLHVVSPAPQPESARHFPDTSDITLRKAFDLNGSNAHPPLDVGEKVFTGGALGSTDPRPKGLAVQKPPQVLYVGSDDTTRAMPGGASQTANESISFRASVHASLSSSSSYSSSTLR